MVRDEYQFLRTLNFHPYLPPLLSLSSSLKSNQSTHTMPQKKKKSGRTKAKKTVGNRKKKENEQGSLDAQMEELKIDDEASMLEEAIKLAAAEREAMKSRDGESDESTRIERKMVRPRCNHGYVPGDKHAIFYDCAQTCLKVQLNDNWVEQMRATLNVLSDKYPGIWRDKRIKLIISLYSSQGTHNLLDGDLQSARYFAFLACFFENYLAAQERQNLLLDPAGAVKQFDNLHADEHTLVKYFRKRIPCNCLDEKYKEVKSITKMGRCCNEKCSLPNRMAERSSMLVCTKCRLAHYCSRRCQKANWSFHKEYCEKACMQRAEMESRGT